MCLLYCSVMHVLTYLVADPQEQGSRIPGRGFAVKNEEAWAQSRVVQYCNIGSMIV